MHLNLAEHHMYSSPSRPKHSQATTVNYTPGIYQHQGASTAAIILSTPGIYENNRTRGLAIAVVDSADRLGYLLTIAGDLKQVMSALNKALVKNGGWYVGQLLFR